MRILITGGAGFQGSHLATHWVKAGHQVTTLNTFSEEAARNINSAAPEASVVWGSVTDPEIVEKTVRSQDVVVHMAAGINVDKSISTPESFLNVNVKGTYNVLEAVRRVGTRLIYASSCEAYGITQPTPIPESAEMRPRSPYAASKAAADRLCFAYVQTYGLNVVIVRPCNIFGERQKEDRDGAVIPIFVKRALENKPLVIYGSGEQHREYMHIDDMVKAYDLVLNRDDLAGEAINFGSGSTVSIVELANAIAGRLNGVVEHGPARPGEVARFQLDSAKANGLGFAPKVDIWQGVDRYISWRQRTKEKRRATK